MMILTEINGVRGYLPIKKKGRTEADILDEVESDLKACLCGVIEVKAVGCIDDIVDHFCDEDSSYICGVINEYVNDSE